MTDQVVSTKYMGIVNVRGNNFTGVMVDVISVSYQYNIQQKIKRQDLSIISKMQTFVSEQPLHKL